MQRYLLCVVVLSLAFLCARNASGGVTACAGDCSGDGRVSINELVLAVGIALGRSPLQSCLAADSVADGTVRINELIAAVRRALEGCGAPGSPTSGSPPPEATNTPTNPPLDVWDPPTVPFDSACPSGCQDEVLGAGLAHGGGDLLLRWNPAVDDAIAQWGDCLTSMLDCFAGGGGVGACAAAADCPAECKALFAARAPAGGDDRLLLGVLEGVYVDRGAPCRPAPRSEP